MSNHPEAFAEPAKMAAFICSHPDVTADADGFALFLDETRRIGKALLYEGVRPGFLRSAGVQ
jgi:hypothetical protein